MKVGDLVKYKGDKIVMIAEGPNEVGNIRILLSDGRTSWIHTSEVRLIPKTGNYLKQ